MKSDITAKLKPTDNFSVPKKFYLYFYFPFNFYGKVVKKIQFWYSKVNVKYLPYLKKKKK
jgi:hypothetical protein